ncbi:hypothetical protein [Mariniplasma anaerobium]|uniref:Uncharacterized protein n=1 Tax=Mariniplasma anaerobium TaxID=2735436 RepID=A0A7U9TI23_9MOLU|nr:hypothetical protein [Mariniplasma anaerobium]BCR36675.1 hypothetical protein MPAN_015680 [Mariniplasma anaerobium]
MERIKIFDESINDLSELGVITTIETKKIVIGKIVKTLPVFKIPIELLKYNQKNGRIFSEIFKLKKQDDLNLDDLEIEEYNDEIENLIWNSDEGKNAITKQSINDYGQLENGVVLIDGTVIDGNRRFTCLRKLNRDNPEIDDYKYFKACILNVDSNSGISEKDLRKFELTIQFGQEEKVGYKALNKALSIYNDISNDDISIPEMADILNESRSNINKMIGTVKLVKNFLVFIKAPDDYGVAEDLKIYFTLEPLNNYITKHKNIYSATEIEERKMIYFTYLAGVKFELPTQTLRDKMIKLIFKDPQEYQIFKEEFDELIDDFERELAPKDDDDALERIKDLKTSIVSEQLRSLFDKTIRKIKLKLNSEEPIQILKDVLKSLESINLTPFVNANHEEKIMQIIKLLDLVGEKNDELKKVLDKS